jgi:hypothetical protein
MSETATTTTIIELLKQHPEEEQVSMLSTLLLSAVTAYAPDRQQADEYVDSLPRKFREARRLHELMAVRFLGECH